MRIARDAGDISSLLPTGVRSLADAPHVFVEAVRMGLYFLGFSEMPEEERPPRYIWLDTERMNAHWAIVQENRAAGRAGFDLSSMPQNEYAKQLLAQRR